MARKKVKKDKIPPPTTKERVKEDVETKKIITYLSNNTKNRWNKIKGAYYYMLEWIMIYYITTTTSKSRIPIDLLIYIL
jgi:hypothetical protein